MDDEIHEAISKNSPIIAWIHNISLNQQKYMKSKFTQLNLGHDVRYIMFIYDNPKCSQEDLVKMFGQSKGNIAKILKKLEESEYIKREINPQNRRKYMLTTTKKGDELVPKYREFSRQWESEVGITSDEEEFKNRLIEIAINASKIMERNL